MGRKNRKPGAFMSYAHADNDDGRLSEFRDKLSAQVRKLIGEEFPIFQDHEDIKWGQEWEARIKESLAEVTFFIPIITPSFFKSKYCRDEMSRFLEREERLGLKLILPVYYIDIKDESKCSSDNMVQEIFSRQYADCRDLLIEDLNSQKIRLLIFDLAIQIRDHLDRLPQEKTKPTAVKTKKYKFDTTVQGISDDHGNVSFNFKEFVDELYRKVNMSGWIILPECPEGIDFIASKLNRYLLGLENWLLFIGVTNGERYYNLAEFNHVLDQFSSYVESNRKLMLEKDHIDENFCSSYALLLLVFSDISRTNLYSQCRKLEKNKFWHKSYISMGFYDLSSGKAYADKASGKVVLKDLSIKI